MWNKQSEIFWISPWNVLGFFFKFFGFKKKSEIFFISSWQFLDFFLKVFGFLLYPGHLHGSNSHSGGRARRTKSEAWRLYIYLQHSGPEQTEGGREGGRGGGNPFWESTGGSSEAGSSSSSCYHPPSLLLTFNLVLFKSTSASSEFLLPPNFCFDSI